MMARRLIPLAGRLGLMVIMVALAIACAHLIVLPVSSRRAGGVLPPGQARYKGTVITPGTALKVSGHSNGSAHFYVLEGSEEALAPFLRLDELYVRMNTTTLRELLASPDVEVLAEGEGSIHYERFWEEGTVLLVVVANELDTAIEYDLRIKELVRLVAPKYMRGPVPALGLLGLIMALPQACLWLKARRGQG